MAINYGDLECSPWHIARQEAAADAAFDESDDDEDMAREAEIWAAEMAELDR